MNIDIFIILPSSAALAAEEAPISPPTPSKPSRTKDPGKGRKKNRTEQNRIRD